MDRLTEYERKILRVALEIIIEISERNGDERGIVVTVARHLITKLEL